MRNTAKRHVLVTEINYTLAQPINQPKQFVKYQGLLQGIISHPKIQRLPARHAAAVSFPRH
jgi:hypothetical protein